MIDQRDITALDGQYNPAGSRTGQGVLAYVVDSGFELADDFLDAFGLTYRVPLDCQCTGEGSTRECSGGCYVHFSSDSPRDCTANRHGTRTASILGGRTFGVAPGVQLHPAKNSRSDPHTFTQLCGETVSIPSSRCPSDVTQNALDWILEDYVDQRDAAGGILPAVVSLSLNVRVLLANQLGPRINALVAEGVTVVIAAGNDNLEVTAAEVSSLDPAVIVVGAITRNGERWLRRSTDPDYCLLCGDAPAGQCATSEAGSNFGSGVDLWAPGEYIRGATGAGAVSDPRLNNPLPSGTSFAAPLVAGAAALYLEENPSAAPSAVKAGLIDNATSGALMSLGPESPNRLLYVGPPPSVPAPQARFDVSCTELSCSFDGSRSYAIGEASITSYQWLFGDGTSESTTVPTTTHNYLASGQFTAILRVIDDHFRVGSFLAPVFAEDPRDDPPTAVYSYSCGGSSGTRCTFDAGRSSDDNGITQYRWDFGDGYTAYGVTARHNYRYAIARSVRLTVTDGAGQVGETSRAVFPGTTFEPPVASLRVEACEGLRCRFDGSASSDDVGISFYRWKIGQESAVIGNKRRNHLFGSPGLYDISLTVIDGQSGMDAASLELDLDGFTGSPPVAAFSFECSGLTCTFDGRDSWDDLFISQYSWSFGDGNGTTGRLREHTFAAPGTYLVSLTVTDLADQVSTFTLQVSVSGS